MISKKNIYDFQITFEFSYPVRYTVTGTDIIYIQYTLYMKIHKPPVAMTVTHCVSF